MADNLNDLVDTLQSAFDKAQKSVDDRQNRQIHRQFDVDQNGEAKSLSWSFSTKLDDGKEHTYELIKIPLHNLHPNNSISVTELSIELDCNIETTKNDDEEQLSKVILTKQKNNDEGHKLKIALHREADQKPKISLDGTELAILDSQAEAINIEIARVEKKKPPAMSPVVVKQGILNRLKWWQILLLILAVFIILMLVLFQYSNEDSFTSFIKQLGHDLFGLML